MKITKLPHAGMIIESDNCRLLFDPLLHNDLISDTYGLNAPIRVDKNKLKKLHFDAVFISHDHEDHCNLPSMNLLSRETLIIFPRRALLIPLFLRKLGFKRFQQMSPGVPIKIFDFEIVPTPSSVAFPEVGFIVKNKGHSLWNLVDTRVNQKQIHKMKKDHGSPDLLLCYYQPIRELEVANLKILESGYDRFLNSLVGIAAACSARFILPSSFDIENRIKPGLNPILAPVSKEYFFSLVKKMSPDSKLAIIPIGNSVRITEMGLKNLKSLHPWIQVEDSKLAPPPGSAPEKSNKVINKAEFQRVKNFLNNELILFANQNLNNALKLYPAMQKLKWKLIVNNGGNLLEKNYQVRKGRFEEAEAAENFNFLSIATAADLLDFREGNLACLALYTGGRLSTWGVRMAGKKLVEPLISLVGPSVAGQRQKNVISKLVRRESQ